MLRIIAIAAGIFVAVIRSKPAAYNNLCAAQRVAVRLVSARTLFACPTTCIVTGIAGRGKTIPYLV
jgi:hypothetical protein